MDESARADRLAEKFSDKRYRGQYVEAHTRQMLAKQMRELRGTMTQKQFGRKIGKAQTIVARLEDPSYRGWSLRTMFEIAVALDIAVVARFVDHASFITATDDLGDAALCPTIQHQ